jgi:hypothetical protein
MTDKQDFESAKRKRAASKKFQRLARQSRLWQQTIERRAKERADHAAR